MPSAYWELNYMGPQMVDRPLPAEEVVGSIHVKQVTHKGLSSY